MCFGTSSGQLSQLAHYGPIGAIILIIWMYVMRFLLTKSNSIRGTFSSLEQSVDIIALFNGIHQTLKIH